MPERYGPWQSVYSRCSLSITIDIFILPKGPGR
ncbi:MAG: transposase [Oscillibacter sp.]|nr:transposase [Oscillibacter sp.]